MPSVKSTVSQLPHHGASHGSHPMRTHSKLRHRSSTPTSTAQHSGMACEEHAVSTIPRWWLAVRRSPSKTPRKTRMLLTPHTGFRPPSQAHQQTTDLELYNVYNDGWCLITLSLILLALTNAVPLSSSPKAIHSADTPKALKASNAGSGTTRYALAIVAATVLHHIATGLGAYQHYKMPSHYNTSMWIGVWGNVWLTMTGLGTLAVMQSGLADEDVQDVVKKTT